MQVMFLYMLEPSSEGRLTSASLSHDAVAGAGGRRWDDWFVPSAGKGRHSSTAIVN